MENKNSFIQTLCFIFSFSVLIFSQPLMTDANATYGYKGETFQLGLYEGTNEMPAEQLAAGLEIAKEMRNMDIINIVPIGHSVPTGIFSGWNWDDVKSQFDLAENTNLSNACAGAVMAWDWLSNINRGGGIPANDIHVLVVQLTWAPFMGPDDYEINTPLSEKIDSMSHDLGRLAKDAIKNYPNLKMILFEADPWQNDHEPYHAYHEWFFSRQVVLDQINSEPDYTGPDVDEVWIDLGGYI